MAPGSGFPVKISKVADADWSYCGDEWTRKSLVKLDSSNNVSGLAKNTSFLSGSWIASDEGPDVGYASHEQSPFTPSSLMGGIQNGYHGNLEDKLSLFLQDKCTSFIFIAITVLLLLFAAYSLDDFFVTLLYTLVDGTW